MRPGPPADALAQLKRAAEERWRSAHGDQTRVAVQVGHCSQAVGAAEVLKTLADSVPESAYVVEAGCDGACFEGTKVVVTDSSGSVRTYTRVDTDGANRIANTIGAGVEAPDSGTDGFFTGQQRIALDMCGQINPTSLDDYLTQGGYGGLARALSMTAEQVVEEVKASGLRGRGGAYFPAALKWEGARAVDNAPRYLVVNAEEGEPGIFKDRHLMEGAPQRIIEGAVIAAYASEIHKAYIYINAEADLSAARMQRALDDADEAGLLGEDILSSGFTLRMEIRRGAGGYVCGEETTLLNTMEGYRREPRLRPPFPTEAGLWARPTVINNPETLASVPFILAEGSKAFAEIGTDKASGTKIVSLSGSVQRPGLAEVAMGTSLREVIYDVGGGPASGHTLTAVAVGGPSSGVFPPSMLDTPIGPGPLHESGVILGAGGVIVLDERLGVVEVVRKLAAYNADESCGKCTPCREGTPRIVDALDRLISGTGSPGDLDELRYLAEVVGLASLCGLGQAAGGPINSALHFFGDELAALAGVE